MTFEENQKVHGVVLPQPLNLNNVDILGIIMLAGEIGIFGNNQQIRELVKNEVSKRKLPIQPSPLDNDPMLAMLGQQFAPYVLKKAFADFYVSEFFERGALRTFQNIVGKNPSDFNRFQVESCKAFISRGCESVTEMNKYFEWHPSILQSLIDFSRSNSNIQNEVGQNTSKTDFNSKTGNESTEKKSWWQFWKKAVDLVDSRPIQQPISPPKQSVQNSNVPINLEFDNRKYGQAIADALNNLVDEFKNMTNPMQKMQGVISFENVRELQEQNQIPPFNSLTNTVEFLKIYNRNNLNVFIHIDPQIATDLLALITERIYLNGGGKVELEATFREIGVPEEEIEISAAAGLAQFLMKNMHK
jgi:hypothetical protein